jgi:hypothetical protein
MAAGRTRGPGPSAYDGELEICTGAVINDRFGSINLGHAVKLAYFRGKFIKERR